MCGWDYWLVCTVRLKMYGGHSPLFCANLDVKYLFISRPEHKLQLKPFLCFTYRKIGNNPNTHEIY